MQQISIGNSRLSKPRAPKIFQFHVLTPLSDPLASSVARVKLSLFSSSLEFCLRPRPTPLGPTLAPLICVHTLEFSEMSRGDEVAPIAFSFAPAILILFSINFKAQPVRPSRVEQTYCVCSALLSFE